MSRILPCVLPLLSATLGCGLAAQSGRAIFPSNHAGVEGLSAEGGLPFSSGVSRVQLVYESWDLQVPDGAQIKAVGFRQDSAQTTSTGYALQLEVLMGTTALDILNLSSTFANNTTAPPLVVFSKKVFNLPTLTPPSGKPTTVFVSVPLDTPHTYSSAANLVVEYRVYANANSSQSFPYYLDAASSLPVSQTYGSGCATSGGLTPKLAASGGTLSQSWSLSLSNGPGSQNVGFLVAGQQQSLQLPGAPGCSALVSLSPVVVVPALTSSSGTAGKSFTIPNNLWLHGKTLYGQIAIVDPFANALGVVTSNGVQTTFCTLPRAASVTAIGSTSATTGNVQPYQGIVSSFDY